MNQNPPTTTVANPQPTANAPANPPATPNTTTGNTTNPPSVAPNTNTSTNNQNLNFAPQNSVKLQGQTSIFDNDDPKLYKFNKTNTAIPIRHGPSILNEKGSLKSNPAPFPNNISVIDTILDRTKVKKISQEDVYSLIHQYEHSLQAREYEKAKFKTLENEREYYKDYFPNIEHKQKYLKSEVQNLEEQTRYLRENSRYDRQEIENQIQKKQQDLSQKDKMNMTLYEETMKMEAQLRDLENQFSSGWDQFEAPAPRKINTQDDVEVFLNNYNASEISEPPKQTYTQKQNSPGYQNYLKNNSPGQLNTSQTRQAYPYHNYDFAKQAAKQDYMNESLFSRGSGKQPIEVLGGGGYQGAPNNPLMRQLRF